MKILFLVSTIAAVIVPSPLSAQPKAALAVSTAGLDLGSPSGIRALDLRITHAASAVCGTPSPADARGLIKLRQCRAEARANASADRSRAIEFARKSDPVEIATLR